MQLRSEDDELVEDIGSRATALMPHPGIPTEPSAVVG
jgi:hypothetical protein